jgi:hypothetical protein
MPYPKRRINAATPTMNPNAKRMPPDTPKKSIGLRPNRSVNHTDSRSVIPTGMRLKPNFEVPARRGCSVTGRWSTRNPSAAATTTMNRCQSGRFGTTSITSRRYALTALRSVTRMPNSHRQRRLYTPDTSALSYCPCFVPVMMSASPARIGSTSCGISRGRNWRSAG